MAEEISPPTPAATAKAAEPCGICKLKQQPTEVISTLHCKNPDKDSIHEHKFHASCLLPWLENDKSCPNDRLPVSDADFNAIKTAVEDFRDARDAKSKKYTDKLAVARARAIRSARLDRARIDALYSSCPAAYDLAPPDSSRLLFAQSVTSATAKRPKLITIKLREVPTHKDLVRQERKWSYFLWIDDEDTIKDAAKAWYKIDKPDLNVDGEEPSLAHGEEILPWQKRIRWLRTVRNSNELTVVERRLF